MSDTFSTQKVRRSLAHFAIGRVISGLISLTMLVAMVRLLPAADYGVYVTFVALLEIVLLVSNLGAYPFAQRYITEAIFASNKGYLPALAWGSVLYRGLTLAAVVAALIACADALLAFFSIPAPRNALVLYGIAIFGEGTARYIDLLFDSLLEQARTQVCILVRNGARLALVLGAAFLGARMDISLIAGFEAIAATGGMLFSLLVLWKFLKPFCQSASAVDGESPFTLARLVRFSMPYYLAQCFTQIYSPDTVKLLVSRLLGILDAAAFGFAHAISFVLQRYLPAQLLIGLIRPVLVSRQVGGTCSSELTRLGNLILKVNHFLLVPIISYFVIVGSEFQEWLSKGKINDASHVLVLLAALLLAQGVHVILSAIAIALEDRRSVLIGTVAAVPGVAFGMLLTRAFGVEGMAYGLWLSELLWCGVTWMLLRRQGFHFEIDWLAWLKFAAAGFAAGLITDLAGLDATGFPGLTMVALLLGLLYLVACYVLKPFTTRERETINKLLPKPVFVF